MNAETRPEGQDAPSSLATYPWKRLAFSAALLVMAGFAFWLIVIAAAVQFGLRFFNTQASADLKRVMRVTGVWFAGVTEYVTLGREEAPFPFGPLPRA
jgi:Na+/proline symporter